MDQLTGGMWLIRGTKHCKENQLPILELPSRIILVEKLNMT